MRVEHRQLAERQGVSLAQSLTVTDLGWLFREQAVSDVGIDAHLEIVIDGRATGRLLALQIKSGDSYFREAVTDGFVYRGDPKHLDYWLNHSLPVVVVICRPGTGEAYWQLVSDQTVTRTDRAWKMTIPSVNRFRAEAMTRLQEIALARGAASEERHQLASPEGLTHPDAMLGALLADSDLFDKGRCVIETSSITYTCCRIASAEDLMAVLVGTNSPDGTALVLRRAEGRWTIAADIRVRTKYSDSLPARFVRAESGYCLVIQYPTMWGTGTLLEAQRWYLLSKDPRLILSFPVRGYVVGWGLLFDREIKGECTSVPDELRGGARVDLKFTVRYSPSSDIPKYRGINGFDTVCATHLEWQQASEAFSVMTGSASDWLPSAIKTRMTEGLASLRLQGRMRNGDAPTWDIRESERWKEVMYSGLNDMTEPDFVREARKVFEERAAVSRELLDLPESAGELVGQIVSWGVFGSCWAHNASRQF